VTSITSVELSLALVILCIPGGLSARMLLFGDRTGGPNLLQRRKAPVAR
jgi:hypothetical protein